MRITSTVALVAALHVGGAALAYEPEPFDWLASEMESYEPFDYEPFDFVCSFAGGVLNVNKDHPVSGDVSWCVLPWDETSD